MDVFKVAKKFFDEVAAVEGKLVVGIEIKDPARDAYVDKIAISTLLLIYKIREFEHALGRLVKIVAIDSPEKKRPDDPLVQYVTKSGLALLGPCAELVSRKGPVMRYAVLDIGEDLPDKLSKPPEKALRKAYERVDICPVGACGEEFDYKACESYRKRTEKKFSKKLVLRCVLCRYLKD